MGGGLSEISVSHPRGIKRESILVLLRKRKTKDGFPI